MNTGPRSRPAPRPLRQRRPDQPELAYGRVVSIEPGYPREVKVPLPLLAIVLVAASLVRAIGGLLRSLLGTAGGTSARPRWKALRKGPEFLVTPVLLRDPDRRLVPLEVHGHMSSAALVVGDRIRADLRWPRDASLPPRAVRIENLSTGRMLRPRGATLWSHLGLGLLLQALVGLVLLGLIVLRLLRWV